MAIIPPTILPAAMAILSVALLDSTGEDLGVLDVVIILFFSKFGTVVACIVADVVL